MTNLVCVLVSVLAYEEEEDLEPVGVQMLGPLPLVQTDDPPPAVCVPAHEEIKGTVSWDRLQIFWQKLSEQGLTKGRGWFLKFFMGLR